jgi:hypothetical protein
MLSGVTMRLFPVALGLIVMSAPVQAQRPDPQARPETLTRMLGCRALQSTEERLACYDREVAAFEAAESSRQIVVMDRQEVRRTRRTLFGLPLPDLGIFGDATPDEEEGVSEITSTVRSATRNQNGQWVIVLEDGARWVQTDTRGPRRAVSAGMPIRIRRAALGSYMANIGEQSGIRVRRDR